jgi:hypothetical protein
MIVSQLLGAAGAGHQSKPQERSPGTVSPHRGRGGGTSCWLSASVSGHNIRSPPARMRFLNSFVDYNVTQNFSGLHAVLVL